TYRLLSTVTGIGPQTAIALSTLLARIRFANADAIVAYSGLDPRPKESGKYIGQRKVSKQGDKRLRALLYNGACSACQTKAFNSYYRALRERGLATTEALVILARKLLRIAYGVWRTQRPFDPGLLKPGLT
ncbi:MAG TPA: transposase, partial [Candidimonas sp.]|nr:transposase [Candidimonas sp.]